MFREFLDVIEEFTFGCECALASDTFELLVFHISQGVSTFEMGL